MSTCCIQSLEFSGAEWSHISGHTFTQPWRGRGGDGIAIFLWFLKKEGAGSPFELRTLVSPFPACPRILLQVQSPGAQTVLHFTVELLPSVSGLNSLASGLVMLSPLGR